MQAIPLWIWIRNNRGSTKKRRGQTVEKKYTFEEFLEIIKTLRSENGCPWDREQTHESLKPCVMEEAAELAAAIRIYDRTGDSENMVEELGDLLLQVVMHSQIGSEEGIFSIEDVIHGVSEKMVRRHPHVFGDALAENSEQVLNNWEDIKKAEKEGKTWIESPLREIPLELPALTRAVKVSKKVDKLYEKRSSYEETIAQMKELTAKLEGLTPQVYDEEIASCVGDLLVAVTDICRINKLTPEQILTDKIEEMIEKYESLE